MTSRAVAVRAALAACATLAVLQGVRGAEPSLLLASRTYSSPEPGGAQARVAPGVMAAAPPLPGAEPMQTTSAEACSAGKAIAPNSAWTADCFSILI